jgi:hypothetical protein
MPATRARRRHLSAVAFVAALAVLATPACARKYRSENDGQDVGEAICDVRDAGTPEEAQSAIAELNEELDDISDNFSLFTAEDRADIDENLTDMLEHISQGNEVLLQQDVTVIRRSLDNVRDDIGDTGKAAVDGILQGLDDCDN